MGLLWELKKVFKDQEAANIIILIDKIHDEATHKNMNKLQLWRYVQKVAPQFNFDHTSSWRVKVEKSTIVHLLKRRF